MVHGGLVSNYTTAQFRSQKGTCDESKIKTVVDRQYSKPYKNDVVSDLTYVRIG